MNMNEKCCNPAPIPVPAESLPSISNMTAELLMDTENAVRRVLSIIDSQAAEEENGNRAVECFRDSLLDLRERAERLNILSRRLLEAFQS